MVRTSNKRLNDGRARARRRRARRAAHSLQPLDPAPCAGVLDTLFNASALPDRAAWRAAIHAAQHTPDCASAPVHVRQGARDGSRVHGQRLGAPRRRVVPAAQRRRGCTLVTASGRGAAGGGRGACAVTAGGRATCSGSARARPPTARRRRVLASPQRIADVRALCGPRARGGRGRYPRVLRRGGGVRRAAGEAVRRAVHELAAALALGDCAGRVPLNATVAVHVRHGDKLLYHTDGNTDAHAALALAHATARRLRAVHFMSDSLAALSSPRTSRGAGMKRSPCARCPWRCRCSPARATCRRTASSWRRRRRRWTRRCSSSPRRS